MHVKPDGGPWRPFASLSGGLLLAYLSFELQGSILFGIIMLVEDTIVQ